MKLETWMYKQALELYPRAYREQFGSAMLETYSDALKAAKLEGETFGFHLNTFLDIIKSVFRATLDVKNADPMSRVTAVLGFVLLLVGIVSWLKVPFSPILNQFILLVAILYFIAFSFVCRYLYEMKQKWLFPLIFRLYAINLSILLCVRQFYPSNDLTFFYVPQQYPTADLTILILGYTFKILGVLAALFFVIGIVFDTIERRRILPMNRFTYSFIAIAIATSIVDPQRQNLVLTYLNYIFAMVWFVLFLFVCLRLWQQPRALPRVVKTT